MAAMESGDEEALKKLPENLFKVGTAEIKNWLPVIAAMNAAGRRYHQVDYVPATGPRREPATRCVSLTGNRTCRAGPFRTPASVGRVLSDPPEGPALGIWAVDTVTLMSLDELLTRLARIDSCAVSDALDKLMLPSAVTGIQRLSTDRRVSGRVITVKLEQDDGRPASSRHLGTTAIETAQRGDVHRHRAAQWNRRGGVGWQSVVWREAARRQRRRDRWTGARRGRGARLQLPCLRAEPHVAHGAGPHRRNGDERTCAHRRCRGVSG